MKLPPLLPAVLLALSSCKTIPRKSTPSYPTTAMTSDVMKVEETPIELTKPVVSQQIESRPEKFGILFSAGGVRVWSYVNILKEMQKYKMPVAAVAGVEWGAVVAGIYAQNISANEVEWELSKFKNPEEWLDYVKKVFEKKSVAGAKIPFGCSSLNLRNQTSYILNKGQMDSLIPLCLPAAGVIKPYSNSIASMSDTVSLIQFLRSSGATKIILVNAISLRSGKPHGTGLESLENQTWIQASSILNKKISSVDEIIEIDLRNTPVERFDLRRAVLSAPIPQAKDQLRHIANKYGF